MHELKITLKTAWKVEVSFYCAMGFMQLRRPAIFSVTTEIQFHGPRNVS